jgi:hypothetical protein
MKVGASQPELRTYIRSVLVTPVHGRPFRVLDSVQELAPVPELVHPNCLGMSSYRAIPKPGRDAADGTLRR